MTLSAKKKSVKTIVLNGGKRWLLMLALVSVALVALAFRLYNSKAFKPRPVPVRSMEWSRATALPDHIILTYADDPATTQSVTWRTDTTVKKSFAEIALADAAPRFWKGSKRVAAQTSKLHALEVETAETASLHHAVTFSGLLPDTTYAYRVGDGVQWSEWFHFRTASKQAKPFTFLFLGDVQNNILETYSRLVREAYKKAPDARLVLHAGDLVEGAHNERQWHEWFTAAGWLNGSIANLPASGNHEYGGLTQAAHKAKNRQLSVQWQQQFTLPQNGPEGLKETTYFVDYQGVRFVVLNSTVQVPQQVAWLKKVLQNNPNKWTVVTFHHPVFSAAYHKDNKEVRTLWQPLFEQYGVDLVLTGHEHTYTRGQALVGGKPDGPVYVVSVSGGKMYGFGDKGIWKDYQAQLQRKGENTQLFQVVNVDGNSLSFKTYTATGALYDAFQLVKGRDGKSTLQSNKALLAGERTHKNTIAYTK